MPELLAKHNDKRTPTLTYTRVMGYHRPTASFNIGKQGEHAERVQFATEK